MFDLFYIDLRLLGTLGIFALPYIVLRFWALFRTVTLIIKYRRGKAENRSDKKEKAGLILYEILTAILWLPLILFAVWVNIKK